MTNEPIIVDTYADEGPHNWPALPAQVAGAVLKVSQGTYYARDAWLKSALDACRALRAERGDFAIGGYHYLDAHAVNAGSGGAVQASFHLQHAIALGLYTHPDDFVPMLDVEWRAGELTNGSLMAKAALDFADAIFAKLGVRPLLYSNGAELAEHGIVGDLGCSFYWPARYTPDLPATTHAGDGYVDRGWPLARVGAWQFAGDGEGAWAGYRASIPEWGKGDLSVPIAPSGPASWAAIKRMTMKP